MDKNRQKLVQRLMERSGRIMKGLHDINDLPFGDLQLSRPQFMILFFIAPRKAGAQVKDLAKFMGVTPSAVTQFINVLVEKKIVSREENAQDRRIISIKLTNAAKKQFRHFKKEYFASIGNIFTNLSTKEISQFIRLIEKIRISNQPR